MFCFDQRYEEFNIRIQERQFFELKPTNYVKSTFKRLKMGIPTVLEQFNQILANHKSLNKY